MAQHTLSKYQAIILEYLQYVKTTYETNTAIGRRLGMSQVTVRNSLNRLIHFRLITSKLDNGKRCIAITKIGDGYLIILEEIGQP